MGGPGQVLLDEVPTHVCNNVAVTDKTGFDAVKVDCGDFGLCRDLKLLRDFKSWKKRPFTPWFFHVIVF